MKNELRMLKKENKLRERVLSSPSRELFKRITDRLTAARLSAFSAQVIRKELIGMGLEAEQRGSTLAAALGSDEEEFCRRLIESGEKAPGIEMLLIGLRAEAFFILANFLIGYLQNGFRPTGEWYLLNLLTLTVGFSLYIAFGWFYLMPISVTSDSPVVRALPGIIFAGMILFAWRAPLLSGSLSSEITVNFPIIIAVSAVCLVVFELLYDKHIHKTATRYSWQD